jgi:5-methyltetrahydropteroyltriglutamate--homocysteine methyltransferase
VFVGVINPLDERVETPEEVRDRVVEAAECIPLDRLGTTDDCGFSPFSDDTAATRDTAFAKISGPRRRHALAARQLGGQAAV